jgi:hypothetical protein
MRSRWGWGRWGLVLISLSAWVLRLPPVMANRFHADEAWYGYWGLLIGRGRDPWLAGVPVDKPPLLPYLIAGSQALWGNSEFAVRFPGLAAGLVTVLLAAALAWAFYRDRWTATAAAIGMALSPFAILFSATAFTDPLMVALGLAACVAAARSRPGWAGLLVGMALATKQTGLVWLPLAIALQISNTKYQIPNTKSQIPNREYQLSSFAPVQFAICHLLFTILCVMGLVFVWDWVRIAQGAESFWRLGVARYGGLRLIWPQELRARLWGWIGLMRYLFVSPVVNGMLLVGLPLLVWRSAVHRRYARESLTDVLLISFCLVYLLLLWLWAFPVWDRYLLPLVPLLAILLARVLRFLVGWMEIVIGRLQPLVLRLSSAVRHSPFVIRHLPFVIRHLPFAICHLLFAICLALPAWNAAHSRYPVGGDHGAYDGIDEVAEFVHGLPEGTVVYQHWLGWHHSYYLFDSPVYVAYWPTPSWLAEDVRAFGVKEPRYITFPSWESRARVAQALASVGYGLRPVLTATRRDDTPSFTVYRIRPLADQ